MYYLEITEKIESMCRKCRTMVPPDIALLTECAWETQRTLENRTTLEQRVLAFKQCFEDKSAVCEKAGGLCVFASVPPMPGTDKEHLEEAIYAGAKRADEELSLLYITDSTDSENQDISITVSALPCNFANKISTGRILSGNPKDIEKYIIQKVQDICPKICLPAVIGVGFADTRDEAEHLALFAANARYAGSHSGSTGLCATEKRLLRRINRLKNSGSCLEGLNTALSVNVESSADISGTPFCCVCMTCYAIGRQKASIFPASSTVLTTC